MLRQLGKFVDTLINQILDLLNGHTEKQKVQVEPRSNYRVDFKALGQASEALDQGDPDEALRIIDEAIEVALIKSELHFSRASVCIQIGDFQAAINGFTDVIEHYPKSSNLSFAFARRSVAHILAGDTEYGEKDMQTALDHSEADSWNVYFHRGDFFSALRKTRFALTDYKTATALAPEDEIEHWRVLATLGSLHFELREYHEALDYFTQAISHKLDEAELYFQRSDCYFRLGDLDKALEEINHTIELDPQFVNYQMRRAYIYYLMGRRAEAIAEHTHILEQDPTNGIAHGARAYMFALTGELEAAAQGYDRAIELTPNEWAIYGNRARSYITTDNYQQALLDFQKAAKIAPTQILPLAGIAIAHHALGNLDEAKVQWKDFRKQFPKTNVVNSLEKSLASDDPFLERAREIVIALDAEQEKE